MEAEGQLGSPDTETVPAPRCCCGRVRNGPAPSPAQDTLRIINPCDQPYPIAPSPLLLPASERSRDADAGVSLPVDCSGRRPLGRLQLREQLHWNCSPTVPVPKPLQHLPSLLSRFAWRLKCASLTQRRLNMKGQGMLIELAISMDRLYHRIWVRGHVDRGREPACLKLSARCAAARILVTLDSCVYTCKFHFDLFPKYKDLVHCTTPTAACSVAASLPRSLPTRSPRQPRPGHRCLVICLNRAWDIFQPAPRLHSDGQMRKRLA